MVSNGQAMSDKRLAEIQREVFSATAYDGRLLELLDEVLRLRARERPLLVLLRAVAAGEPLHENFMWQARGWLEAERSGNDGG